jgi:hypothetical protein
LDSLRAIAYFSLQALRVTFKHFSNLAWGFPADVITAEFQFDDGLFLELRQFALKLSVAYYGMEPVRSGDNPNIAKKWTRRSTDYDRQGIGLKANKELVTVPNRPSLPARFPLGTKYIIERQGKRVKRYVEYPSGRRVFLPSRKALNCFCLELQQIGIVPNPAPDVIDAKATS